MINWVPNKIIDYEKVNTLLKNVKKQNNSQIMVQMFNYQKNLLKKNMIYKKINQLLLL